MQLGSAELFMQESKYLIHGNGKDKTPTGFQFEKNQMKGLYFNQSPAKVSCTFRSSVILKESPFFYASH